MTMTTLSLSCGPDKLSQRLQSRPRRLSRGCNPCRDDGVPARMTRTQLAVTELGNRKTSRIKNESKDRILDPGPFLPRIKTDAIHSPKGGATLPLFDTTPYVAEHSM